jgi:hypothetical protein
MTHSIQGKSLTHWFGPDFISAGHGIGNEILRYEWEMTDSIRVRVARLRAGGSTEETYVADARIGVDRPFFSSLIGLIDEVDPGGLMFPHGPRGNRSSEPYVREISESSEEETVLGYKPLLRVWAIREPEGTLSSWGFVDRRELLIGDILRASDAGYNTQDFRDIIIRGEAGRGGDYLHYDWASFLGGLGLGLATNFIQSVLTLLASRVGMVVRTKRDDAAMAAVAKRWQERGITSPYVLREWFDKSKSHSALEVARRLQLPTRTAIGLLQTLGYETIQDDADTFIRSHKKRAKKRRRQWKKQETQAGIDAW